MIWHPLASEPVLFAGKEGKGGSPKGFKVPVEELDETFGLVLNVDLVNRSCGDDTELFVVEPLPEFNAFIDFNMLQFILLVQIVDL